MNESTPTGSWFDDRSISWWRLITWPNAAVVLIGRVKLAVSSRWNSISFIKYCFWKRKRRVEPRRPDGASGSVEGVVTPCQKTPITAPPETDLCFDLKHQQREKEEEIFNKNRFISLFYFNYSADVEFWRRYRRRCRRYRHLNSSSKC